MERELLPTIIAIITVKVDVNYQLKWDKWGKMSRKSTGRKFSFHLKSSSEESDPKATHMRRLEQVIYKE